MRYINGHYGDINHWRNCPQCYVGLLHAEQLGVHWASEALAQLSRELREKRGAK